MSLSNQTIQDKNALATDAVFLVLLEIQIPSIGNIYLVNNTESISWNGNYWISFQFELEDMSHSTKSEVPQWTIKISNVNRVMERYIQLYDQYLKANGVDGNEITCIIRVVNTNDLNNTTPIGGEHKAILTQPTTTPQWATFKLSAKNPYNRQFPPRKILKNFCYWKFKDGRCGYTGSGAFCDKTLTTCRSYGNSSRFGGFVGVAGQGLTVAV